MDRGKRRSPIWKFKKIVLSFSGWSMGPGSPEILLDLLIPNKIQVTKRAPLTIISSASRSYTMVMWSRFFFWCPEKTWVLSFSRVSLHPRMMKSKNNELAPLKHGEFGVSTCFTSLGSPKYLHARSCSAGDNSLFPMFDVGNMQKKDAKSRCHKSQSL